MSKTLRSKIAEKRDANVRLVYFLCEISAMGSQSAPFFRASTKSVVIFYISENQEIATTLLTLAMENLPKVDI